MNKDNKFINVLTGDAIFDMFYIKFIWFCLIMFHVGYWGRFIFYEEYSNMVFESGLALILMWLCSNKSTKYFWQNKKK